MKPATRYWVAIRYLRWAGVVPAAVLAWQAVFVLGLLLLSTLDSFCPPALVVSGHCTADWHPAATRAVFVLCAGLAAFSVVLGAALVAPAHRRLVAATAFGIGLVVAACMAVPIGAGLELLAATAAGWAGIYIAAGFAPPPASADGAGPRAPGGV